jgi:RsiW-degrading membrane proteinase PrsW (M82 family)
MRRAILVLAVIVGVVAILSGLAAGGVALFGILAGSDLEMFDLLTSSLAFAVAAAGMGLGAVLVWHGWRALTGRPGAAFTLPAWGWWLAAFALVLIAGRLLISARIDFFVPALHALAAALPPLLYLALAAGAARRGGRVVTVRGLMPPEPSAEVALDAGSDTLLDQEVRLSPPISPARSTWGSLAWGGLGGVGLGLFVEAVALVLLVVAAAAVLSIARPDLLAQLEALATEMQGGGAMPDMASMEWLTSPLVVLGVLLFASLFVPVVEELAKSLAVPIVGLTGRRLTRLDGFLLGVAAGAGFAVVEGMLNGALGLVEPSGWAGAMLTRGGASAMHCLASGLFGLGWQAVISERRFMRGVGLAALSVGLHGLWNAGAVAVGLSALVPPTVGFGALGLRDVQAFFIGAALVVLWLLAVATLAWLPRRLTEE